MSPLFKLKFARCMVFAGMLLIPFFGYSFDIGLLVGLYAFAGWNSVWVWYIESDRWLPVGIRKRWKKLSWLYGVERKPLDVEINHSGWTYFVPDRATLAFQTDVGVSSKGLYLNVRHLGRLWISWDKDTTFRRARIPAVGGWTDALTASIPEVEGMLLFSWDRKLDDVPPKRVALLEN
ncbi:MAG: hypothetical protein KF911_11575 [Pseudomonadales bacterium]|nr:hypothetical protein [Pseudomonadales bacterium]